MPDPGRDVFLAFLGTSPYGVGSYTVAPETLTRFVQVALIDGILRSIEGPVHVFVFTTRDAAKSNWSAEGRGYEGLERELATRGERLRVECVPIPDGGSEAEYWAIFQALIDVVEPGDRLYIDVTHGFRSLPVLLVKALDFVVRAKGAEVVRLDYGAWEAKAPQRLPGPPPADPPPVLDVPVFDLKPFLTLDAWAGALATYRHGGDLLALARTIGARVGELRKVHRADLHGVIGRLPVLFHDLGVAMEHCRLREIPGSAHALCAALIDASAAAAGYDALKPLAPLIDDLRGDLTPLAAARDAQPAARLLAQVAAAAHHFERERYLNGYTLLRETLVDLVAAYVEAIGEPLPPRKEFDRDVFGLFAGPGGTPRTPLASRVWEAGWARELQQVARGITDTRNRLDHAGTADGIPPSKRLQTLSQGHVRQVRACLDRIWPDEVASD